MTPTPGWELTVIHQFDPKSGDGSSSWAGLVNDSAGNLFGTTYGGGTFGFGTVFEIISNEGVWTEQVLYSFAGGGDGANPEASVVLDQAGNVYGTTASGGSRAAGTVFKLTPNGEGQWTKTSFRLQPQLGQGAAPAASLLLDDAGNVYGTASASPGVVFRIAQ